MNSTPKPAVIAKCRGPWFAKLNLGLTLWEGKFENWDDRWLRWCDRAGDVLPTGEELARRLAEKLPRTGCGPGFGLSGASDERGPGGIHRPSAG